MKCIRNLGDFEEPKEAVQEESREARCLGGVLQSTVHRLLLPLLQNRHSTGSVSGDGSHLLPGKAPLPFYSKFPA